jgi:hypothetical protein
MDREATFTAPEIVGIATAAAASLGGIIVALGRSQAAAARKQVPPLANVPDTARHQFEHGREVARSAAAAVADAYPGMRESAADFLARAAESAAPRASRVGDLAATGAQSARSTGTIVLERLQDVVVPTAVDALSSLRDQASDATSRVGAPTTSVAARGGAIADAAVAKSTSAARESVALLFWLSAAMSLVYLVLLNEERREKVRSFVFGAYEQTRLLVQDFQGYEEDV